MILSTFNQHQEALQYFRQAARLQPNVAQMQFNLGVCLFRLHQLPEAEAVLRATLALDPAHAEARRKLADLLAQCGRFEECFEQYRAIGAWGWLQFAKRISVSWLDLAEVDAAFISELKRARQYRFRLWCLLNMPDLTPQLERTAAHNYAVSNISALKEPTIAMATRAPSTAEPLRIGYLSSDFHNHATAYLLTGVLEAHDL